MQQHPDADAFVLEHLRQPANATTRLVFADWLEETGTPSNVAWAHYIRLREAAERHAPDDRRSMLLRQADEHAAKVRAKLALAARVFARNPEAILQLLPAPNIVVRFGNLSVPQAILELMPESVARENDLLPLALCDNTLYCATTEPRNFETAEKLRFILNKDIVLAGAEQDEIEAAINREYGESNISNFDSPPYLVSFTDVAGGMFSVDLTDPTQPNRTLIESLLVQALRMGAERVRLVPEGRYLALRYHCGDRCHDHERLPGRFWPAIAEVFAAEARMPLTETFADRVAAYSGVKGSFFFFIARTRYTIGVSVRLGSVEPGVALDIPRAPDGD